jgi:hypothetical protein
MKHVREAVADGRLFSVTFRKKNNELRTMVARTGVKKYTRGGVNKNCNPNHLIVYSIKDQGYRTVNTETITKIKINGVEYGSL